MHKLIDICCAITGGDPDIAAVSNRRDRQQIVANSVLLLLAATLAFAGWAVFLASSLPWQVAMPGALLVASIVFMMDRAMCAADWDMAGILQSGARDQRWWGKVIARCSIALVFATSTATGMLLAWFSGAIDDQLQRTRALANAPLQAEYAAKTADARSRAITPVEAQLLTLRQEQALVQKALTSREEALGQARSQAAAARIEAGREKDGGLKGYVSGEGGRFKEAVRQENAAATMAAQVMQDAQALQKRYDSASNRITVLGNELVAAGEQITQVALLNQEAMTADPRWQIERRDPLSRFTGLRALQKDPVHGTSVTLFAGLFEITMLVLELAFLFVKFFCASASIYLWRLTTQTQLEAVRIRLERDQLLEALHHAREAIQSAQSKVRPLMRVT